MKRLLVTALIVILSSIVGQADILFHNGNEAAIANAYALPTDGATLSGQCWQAQAGRAFNLVIVDNQTRVSDFLYPRALSPADNRSCVRLTAHFSNKSVMFVNNRLCV